MREWEIKIKKILVLNDLEQEVLVLAKRAYMGLWDYNWHEYLLSYDDLERLLNAPVLKRGSEMKEERYKELLERRKPSIPCPCGGYMDDWSSHASDCFVINPQGRCYWCNPIKEKENEEVK